MEHSQNFMAARSSNRTSTTTGTRTAASRRSSGGGGRGADAGRSSRSAGKSAAPRRISGKPRGKAPAKADRKRSGPGLVAWIVLAAVVGIALWMYPVVKMHYQEQRQLISLKAEYEAAKTRNMSLNRQVQRLKTREGVEEAARQTLGLVRKGENAYVVMEQGSKGTAGATTATADAPARASAATDPVTMLLDAVFGTATDSP